MAYRTRTYIAGDWTNDKNAIDQLYKWNNSDYWGLDFVDVHQFHQSNDGSLNCSIKRLVFLMVTMLVGRKTTKSVKKI